MFYILKFQGQVDTTCPYRKLLEFERGDEMPNLRRHMGQPVEIHTRDGRVHRGVMVGADPRKEEYLFVTVLEEGGFFHLCLSLHSLVEDVVFSNQCNSCNVLK